MKKVKILTITLTIVLITMIAFGGIYIQYQNRMENKVKDYSYAMDLNGARNITLKVNTESTTVIKDAQGNIVEDSDTLTDEEIATNGYTKEEIPYNSEDVKTEQNYKKSKDVIEKRLKKLGVENYIIKLNENNGDIIIELPENSETDSIISNINTDGKFEIIDTQTNEVLMNNDDIKKANVLYGTDTSQGTAVYLNIEFNKEGSKKLEDISNKYVEVEESENTTENQTTDEVTNDTTEENTEDTTEKTITMKIDDTEIMSTSFEETVKTGSLQLSIGSAATDEETLKGYIEQASNIATVLDTGKIPVKYELYENKYILSDITENELQIVKYTILTIALIALILLIIKYKSLGIIGTISHIGLISILMLIIRYANVVLSIEGILGIVIILILNYIFVFKLLSTINKNKESLNRQNIKNASKETYKEFFIKIVPIIIMIIIFCFIKWTPISSFGMVMFWGITLIAIYNIIITNNLLKIKADIKRR